MPVIYVYEFVTKSQLPKMQLAVTQWKCQNTWIMHGDGYILSHTGLVMLGLVESGCHVFVVIVCAFKSESSPSTSFNKRNLQALFIYAFRIKKTIDST